jgi:hypothetical protein
MNATTATMSPVRLLTRWAARITSLFLLGLVAVFMIGNGGPPNPVNQPASVQLEFGAIALILFGLVLGWLREALGGLLILLGLLAFDVVEVIVNGVPARGAFPLFVVPGVLFLLSALIQRRDRERSASH